MDDTTHSVRAMYEAFPYPSGPIVMRVGNDVEQVVALGTKAGERAQGPLFALDAGCGRARGLLGAATLQPKVRWHGIDISRVSLDEARRDAEERGLDNVRFSEVDLMTLEGLEVPGAGFDLIVSSGVLHHLRDPAVGLAKLREVLAPHGVINLMVYGIHGRKPLQDLAEAIGWLFADETPLAERVTTARIVALLARDRALAGTFPDTAEVDDVELVDRLLNVNETSYDVPGILSLLEGAGLRLLRWVEPADWDVARALPPQLHERVMALPEAQRWAFIERVKQPAGLELFACHADNAPAPPLQVADIEKRRFRVGAEVVLTTGVRHTPGEVRTESMTVTVRRQPPIALANGPIAGVLLHLVKDHRPRKGRALLRELQELGLAKDDAQAVILELVRAEILAALP